MLYTHTLLILTMLLFSVEQAGNTALHWAARYHSNNSLEMAQLLLATKAAIDVQNKVMDMAACKWPHAVF